jgi:adenylate kinase
METEELRTIWVCLGVPGSGKTTWSLEQLVKHRSFKVIQT